MQKAGIRKKVEIDFGHGARRKINQFEGQFAKRIHAKKCFCFVMLYSPKIKGRVNACVGILFPK